MIVEAHRHTHTRTQRRPSPALRYWGPFLEHQPLAFPRAQSVPGCSGFGDAPCVPGHTLDRSSGDLRLLRRENTHVEPRSPSPARQGRPSGIAEPFARLDFVQLKGDIGYLSWSMSPWAFPDTHTYAYSLLHVYVLNLGSSTKLRLLQ